MTGQTPAVPHACVVGWPIEHSRSPLIHSFWLNELGLTGRYSRQAVEPRNIAYFLTHLRDAGFVGCNVTIPHKEAAFNTVSEADATARRLGAVNTIWFEDGQLAGANTDVYGFMANLDAEAPGWDDDPGRAIVLGAGGAARAIVFALMQRKFDPIHVINRTLSRAEGLAAEFGPTIRPHSWADFPNVAANARILVNTTSLGMSGQPPLDIDLTPLPSDILVTDIVYTPLVTPLLERAKDRGLSIVDGLGMLLHQAVPGFEKWFGARPMVTPALRRHILDSLDPQA